MTTFTVLALRVLLILLGAGLLGSQVWLVPELAGEIAASAPEFAYLAAPYVTLAVLVLACGEVVLVAIWVLLSRIGRGAIFAASAFRWVDAIIGAGGVATVLLLVLFINLSIAVSGPPLLALLLLAGILGGTAFVLLMFVMRGLLRSATALESELAEVV